MQAYRLLGCGTSGAFGINDERVDTGNDWKNTGLQTNNRKTLTRQWTMSLFSG